MRFWASALLLLAMAGLWSSASRASDSSVPAITVITIGDSLLTGYGVSAASSFPALLEQRIRDAGYDASVVDAGLQYTSRSGAFFIDHPYSRKEGRVIDLFLPNTVAIVELGSNDCKAGLAIAETRENLAHILSRLSAIQVPVLLVGTAAFESCGADYAIAFQQTFSQLAVQHGVPLYPEFMTGVLGRPELLQEDQEHPNEAGELVVVDKLLPVVVQLFESLRRE